MRAKIRRREARQARFERRTDPGAPPGTLMPDASKPVGHFHAIAYGPDGVFEQAVDKATDIPDLLARWPVTWINVDGLGDVSVVRELGQMFNLHNLALEDVVHVHQRAKVEAYGDHYFIVARMPNVAQPWHTEQISIFFGKNFVLTFQEHPGGDCLEPVRVRIRTGWGRARSAKPDYLVYAILDTIVDHYFPLVEECGEQLDELEEEVSDSPAAPTHRIMSRVHGIKRHLITVRRIIWPLRDAINSLLRDPTPLVCEETRIYLRDVHDHTIQILDLVESYRDISSGVTEVYLSSVSLRTNEIMKVLTIMSSIFIPLTFIVGVYGMNFETAASPWNMPELQWAWGYPLIWSIMIVIAGAMLFFFYRRGWLSRPTREPESE